MYDTFIKKERGFSLDQRFEVIKEELGKPYYEDKDVLLYNMDSVKALKRLKDKKLVDLTVTSPPYNIGKSYEKVKPLDEYIDWSKEWIKTVYDVTKDKGEFWLNLGYLKIDGIGKAVPISYLLWDKTPFYMIQELVWHYGAGVSARRSLSPRNEKVLWYVKDPKNYVFNLDSIRDPHVKYPNQKKNGKLKVNSKGKNPSDVWYIPKVTSGRNRSSKERTKHPAQSPIELFKRLILASSNSEDLVLDPFLGSGTTCVAAKNLGRKSVGFEVVPEYLDIAIERLNTEKIQQISLF